MVQGYYTLDEAARLLGMDAERLNQMAQRREIRAFADRGTWRFRTQDVEELARRLGLASNPDLQLGEPSKPASGPRSGPKQSPVPGPKSGPKPASDDDAVFDFSLGATPDPLGEVQHEIVIESPSSHKLGKAGTNISPAPKPGSDSDVHLVFDSGSDFTVTGDSDVKINEGPPSSKILRKAGQAAGSPSPRPTTRKPAPPAGKSGMDSGVRLVPMEEDSALSLGQQPAPAGTDSDIRLSPDRPRRGDALSAPGSHSTEDINLDEELKRADEMSRSKQPRPKAKPKSTPKPVESPSDEAFQIEEPGAPDAIEDDNERTAELRIDSDDSDVPLGELEAPKDLAGSTNVAGINLHAPADSGVNLEGREESSDSLEFELSLEPEATPRPLQEAGENDSSGEFELTLDDASGVEAQPAEGGDTAHVSADSGDQDIFETDFDMPAVEDGPKSGSMGDSVDTELESSDFDLSVGEETGSQVVALEGEEADEGAQTVAYKGGRPPGVPAEGEDVEELLSDDELEQYEEVGGEGRLRRAPVVVAATQADWGIMPALVMLPCVTIMFLLACMGYELMNNMWGYKASYRPTGMIVKTVAGWMGKKITD